MARKPDIRYVQYYTDGSAARKLELPLPRRKKSRLPKVRHRKVSVLHIDPLAIGGIVVSAIMLLMMVLGSMQLYQLRQDNAKLESYVVQLAEKKAQLSTRYEDGYDLEEIEQTALALGMIPAEEAKTITIRVPQPEIQEETSAWDDLCAFLAGIFA